MKKKPIVYVVHCIDTEGPLNEDLLTTFKRLKSIFNISLKASKANLKKIQNQEIDFKNVKKSEVAKVFSKKLLDYNNSWTKINKMLKKILSKKFRNNYKDSFNSSWKYNWFITDHVGFIKNPRNRKLGIHKIWKNYKKAYKKDKIQDGFHFHHHPIPFSKSANHSSTHFFNHTPIIYEILSKKIIDLKWFPSTFRPGFHTIRPDSHWFLEQFIPFDYSNQRTLSNQSAQKDLSSGRFGDWRRAPLSWECYHPSHDDYQIKGSCRRWTARCLNIGTRTRLLEKKDVIQAFKEAKNKPVILAFANHDYRNIEEDIENTYKLILEVSKLFPKVKFKWSEAKQAMRLSLNLKKDKKIHVNQSLFKNILKIRFDKKIFGPQPYLAIKTKKGKYLHDNFDIQKPFTEWSYTFDENSIPLNQIKKIGWAANNSYGSTFVSVFNPNDKKILYKEIR